MSENLLDSGVLIRSLVPILLLFAFILGSVPFGLILARLFKVKDLAQQGSGNIGAANVARVVGFWPAGVLTFALDFGKGALAVFLATPAGAQLLFNLLGGSSDAGQEAVHLSASWGAGFAVVLGHCFSPFLNFRGGKGVATAFGVLLLLSPISAGFGLLGFVIAFLYRRIVSLASMAGLGTATVGFLVLNPIGVHLWFGAATALLVLIRHEKNIDALLENREKVFN